MAIPLREGEHTIKLRYVTPGIRVGSFLSIIGFAGLFIYGVCGKKKLINLLENIREAINESMEKL